MKNIQNLIAGFAGALSLTLLHESLKKKLNDAPRIDLLGEEAVNVLMDKAGKRINDDKKLYATTLAGDLLANSLYYSAIGAGTNYTWTKAITLGLSAGLGAVKLARPLGLNEKTVARNDNVKVLTVLYYLSGALVTAGVIKVFNRR